MRHVIANSLICSCLGQRHGVMVPAEDTVRLMVAEVAMGLDQDTEESMEVQLEIPSL